MTGLHALQPGGFAKQTRKAVTWLQSIQHRDGGFGESPESYAQGHFVVWPSSVASQTAWGAMALIAAGEAKSSAVQRSIEWLDGRFDGASWGENEFTGTGFPGHFYIRYHGYRHYFPLLALARYHRVISPTSFPRKRESHAIPDNYTRG